MKVAPSPTPTPSTAARFPGSVSRPAQDGRSSFANMLRGVDDRAVWRDVASPTADFRRATRFEAETKIGDNAIGFEARAIVAPVAHSVAAGNSRVDVATLRGGEPKTTVREVRAGLEEPVNPAARQPHIRATPLAEDARLAAFPQASTGMAGQRVGKASTASPVHCAGLSVPLPMRIRDGAAVAAAPFASAPPPSPASSIALAAHVMSFPNEILIGIRGLTLSDQENRTLVEEVRKTLAQHRIGDRPIRIAEIGGKV